MNIEVILQNLYSEGIMFRLMLVTLVIVINLVLSVIEAIKFKEFDFKRLPEFVGDWLMSMTGLVVVELLVIYASDMTWASRAFYVLREVIFFAITASFLKRMFESFRRLKWNVNTEPINNYLDNSLESRSNTVVRAGEGFELFNDLDDDIFELNDDDDIIDDLYNNDYTEEDVDEFKERRNINDDEDGLL